MAIALSATAVGAQGAGLGRLNVLSSIGQPLRAEIELTAVGRDEVGSLTARLASPDAFSQASIDYGAALNGLRFSIQRRASGQPYVLVTSGGLVNEPFLDVLVELTWSSGRLVREYTLLIDPPGTGTVQRSIDPGPGIVSAQSFAPPAPRARASVGAGDGPGSGAASEVPRAARTPASAAAGSASGGGAGGDYVVRNGDTAMSIARDNKPAGVSLEQMLAALYRDNRQAFGGNINRLMAGATVKLPDAAAAQTLDASEARRIVAQSANFGSYRERIARNAADAPTSRAPGSQASGRLSTQVEDRAAPAADANDRLQLSRPDATKSSTGTAGTRTGIGAPTADELASKDRELQETRSRVALLEKNVEDLKRLVTLQNESLAKAQAGASGAAGASAAAAPNTSVAAPPAASSVAAAPIAGAATGAAVAPSTTEAPAAPTASTPASAPAPAPAPAPAKAAPPVRAAAPAESSWLDTVRDNTALVSGLAVVVLLLIAYALFTRRRRKASGFEDSIFVDNSVLHANSVFGTTGGQSVDTANSGFHSNFVPVAGNLPEQNEVDPVAEADVYIAYGRDAQAEEILKEALRADAGRHAVRLKLLEIYAKRGDAKTFETMASELYAATGGQGEDWKQAAAMGASIDPQNPLYADVADAPAPNAAAAARQPVPRASTFGETSLGASASMFGLSSLNVADPLPSGAPGAAAPAPVEYTKTDPMPRAEPAAATSPSMNLDFDLGFENAGVAPLSGDASPAPSAPATAPRDGGLDFDVGQSAKPLIDPFTASAFGAGDASARTAVNLPAFRARAEQAAAAAPRADADGFTASDIFGSSIIADDRPLLGETEPDAASARLPDAAPPQARTQDFRVVESNQFDKTEPLDAFGDINLDLDQSGYEAAGKTDFAKTDVWQAMATKLDLALAYSDIGDKDGARELLEEVVRNGDPAQAGRARQLIGELG